MVGFRLCPSGNEGRTGECHAAGYSVPRVRDNRCQNAATCSRLLQGQREPGRSELLHGLATRSGSGAGVRRRSLPDGYKRRILLSTHTKLRLRTSCIQGRRRCVTTAISKLRTVSGSLVLHQGDETRLRSSARDGTSSLLLPQRLLWRRSQLQSSRRVPQGRDYRTIRQAGCATAHTQVGLQRVKEAGDSRNCCKFRERNIFTQRRQAGK